MPPIVDWRRVSAADFRVPADRRLSDLTAELTELLGTPESELRELALAVFCTWIERGVYDDLLPGLGDGIATGLLTGIGERGTDSVFRRSFSALVVAEVIDRDTRRPRVTRAKIHEWGDRLATWFLAERDERGYVEGRGWAHAVAHGADTVAVLARSPHLATPELTVLLDVIADRVLDRTDRLFASGETDRLAHATLEVLRRNVVPLRVLEPWIARVAAGARLGSARGATDPYLSCGNAEQFLRSLYLQLSLGSQPPQLRSDLLLVVVDALKSTNSAYLGPAAR